MNKQKSIFIISLDFEIEYGVEDFSDTDLAGYLSNLDGVREAVPMILKAFKKNDIHATWATVGMLLAETKEDIRKYTPDIMPDYVNKNLSTYSHLARIGTDEKEDKRHYALSLVKRIMGTPGQEIGSHTYSHYYAMEAGQNVEQFRGDIEAAIRITKDKTGVRPISLVLPRNQINPEYINVIRESGFTSFRGNAENIGFSSEKNNYFIRGIRLADSYIGGLQGKIHTFDEIREDYQKTGVFNIKASSFLRPYSRRFAMLEKLKTGVIKRDMKKTAISGGIYHLWFHPHNFGINTKENLRNLSRILIFYNSLHKDYGMLSCNMTEAAELIKNK